MIHLIIGAALISFSGVFVKVSHVTPDVAAFYRMFFGAIGLCAVVAARGGFRGMNRILILGAFFCAVFFLLDIMCWHRSIHFVGVGLATMLANFQVFFVALASMLFLRERMGPRFLISLPVAMIGLYMIVGVGWAGYAEQFKMGVGFGLLAAGLYTMFLMALRMTMNRGGTGDTMSILAVLSLFAAVLLGVGLGATGHSLAIPDLQSFFALAGYGFIGQVLGWGLITRGMREVKTSLVGLILLLQPSLSYVWDVLFFGKELGAMELGGVALALTGIYLGSVSRKV